MVSKNWNLFLENMENEVKTVLAHCRSYWFKNGLVTSKLFVNECGCDCKMEVSAVLRFSELFSEFGNGLLIVENDFILSTEKKHFWQTFLYKIDIDATTQN